MIIDVKEAVKIAREKANSLFDGQVVRNLALEEVEFDDTTNHWLITLGYDSHHVVKKTTGPTIFGTVEEERKRVYKVFRIDGKDGHFVSMKIRDV